MVTDTAATTDNSQYVSANGINVYYVEAGQGELVLLLHAGLLSSRMPIGYTAYLDRFAEQFHVVAPDTRGHGRTVSPTRSPISYDQLADDVVALIDALGLDRPLVCGFSSSDAMRGMFQMMKAEHDAAQGEGYWRTLIAEAFDRFTTSPGYTFEDLSTISVPTLILTGDRDFACFLEDAVTAYRKLKTGELAILPAVEHAMPPQKVDVTIDFLRRHAGIGNP